MNTDQIKAIKIGEVGVDSGHLVIVDPAYADRVNHGNSYTGDKSSKQADGFVSFVSGEGDGDYPVYAILDEDNDIVGVVVWFYDDLPLPYPVVDGEEYRKRFPLEKKGPFADIENTQWFEIR